MRWRRPHVRAARRCSSRSSSSACSAAATGSRSACSSCSSRRTTRASCAARRSSSARCPYVEAARDARALATADHVPAHLAERAAARRRERVPQLRVRARRARRRSRSSASASARARRLGPDALREPRRSCFDEPLGGARARASRSSLTAASDEPRRRLAVRAALRSRAGAMSDAAARASRGAARSRTARSRPRRPRTIVVGLDLDVARRRDDRHRRRVGQRQVADRPGARSGCCRAASRDGRGRLRRAATCSRCPSASCAACAAARSRCCCRTRSRC